MQIKESLDFGHTCRTIVFSFLILSPLMSLIQASSLMHLPRIAD